MIGCVAITTDVDNAMEYDLLPYLYGQTEFAVALPCGKLITIPTNMSLF